MEHRERRQTSVSGASLVASHSRRHCGFSDAGRISSPREMHRVGIANSRLVDVTSEHVTFRTKNGETITLAPTDFLARFVQHVCPRATSRSATTACAPHRTSARASNEHASCSGRCRSSPSHRPQRRGSSCSSRSAGATFADARAATESSPCSPCHVTRPILSRENRHHDRPTHHRCVARPCLERAHADVRLRHRSIARGLDRARRASIDYRRQAPARVVSAVRPHSRTVRRRPPASDAATAFPIATTSHAAKALFITTFARRREWSNCARFAAARMPP